MLHTFVYSSQDLYYIDQTLQQNKNGHINMAIWDTTGTLTEAA